MSGVIQYRYTSEAQLRADTETKQISGYGIVFNSDSQPLHIYDDRHGFVQVVERITERSLDNADLSDVVSAFNHNFEKILGRTTSNTLNLSMDQRGVKYTVKTGNQSYARDLLESLERGDVSGSSFVFTYDMDEGYEVEERDNGTLVATPRKITKVYEMGPVVNPAYLDTTAENRSSAIQDAVKRHLEQKEQPEEIGPDTIDDEEIIVAGPDDERTEESEPEQRAVLPKNYYAIKAMTKKRV